MNTNTIKTMLRFSLAALCALALAMPVHAHGIEEFDYGIGTWKTSPRKISRTTLPGWEVVDRAGDKAAVNNPTTTRYTYYWKLTRTYDLTNTESPELDLKFEFLGGQYASFQVQIGL